MTLIITIESVTGGYKIEVAPCVGPGLPPPPSTIAVASTPRQAGKRVAELVEQGLR